MALDGPPGGAIRIGVGDAASECSYFISLCRVLAEAEALNDATVVERAYFGNLLSQPRDPIGGHVLPLGCRLPAGRQVFINFSAGGGHEALLHMTDWLRRMDERGF